MSKLHKYFFYSIFIIKPPFISGNLHQSRETRPVGRTKVSSWFIPCYILFFNDDQPADRHHRRLWQDNSMLPGTTSPWVHDDNDDYMLMMTKIPRSSTNDDWHHHTVEASAQQQKVIITFFPVLVAPPQLRKYTIKKSISSKKFYIKLHTHVEGLCHTGNHDEAKSFPCCVSIHVWA